MFRHVIFIIFCNNLSILVYSCQLRVIWSHMSDLQPAGTLFTYIIHVMKVEWDILVYLSKNWLFSIVVLLKKYILKSTNKRENLRNSNLSLFNLRCSKDNYLLWVKVQKRNTSGLCRAGQSSVNGTEVFEN